jgi:formylmethanofuran dehydrogenase subunit E
MHSEISEKHLCSRPLIDCFRIIENFHGWKAPGLVIGMFMIDLARELVGESVESDAIVETRHCLPDAIQLFTPCTIGNGWMKIVDWDKFALSLYDRKNRNGYRVWLDLEKTKQFPDLYNWYMRRVPKKTLPLEVLVNTILSAQRAILSYESIYIIRLHERVKKEKITVCPMCKEAYAEKLGDACISCQGRGYYETFERNINQLSE